MKLESSSILNLCQSTDDGMLTVILVVNERAKILQLCEISR